MKKGYLFLIGLFVFLTILAIFVLNEVNGVNTMKEFREVDTLSGTIAICWLIIIISAIIVGSLVGAVAGIIWIVDYLNEK